MSECCCLHCQHQLRFRRMLRISNNNKSNEDRISMHWAQKYNRSRDSKKEAGTHFSKRWLGRQDSNLRMPIPKTGALPLGDAPSWCVARFVKKLSYAVKPFLQQNQENQHACCSPPQKEAESGITFRFRQPLPTSQAHGHAPFGQQLLLRLYRGTKRTWMRRFRSSAAVPAGC